MSRKTISVPIKTDLKIKMSELIKILPKPHPCIIPQPAIETRSRLFDPEIIEVPKRKKPGRVRQVEKGTMNIAMPELRKGTMNRPDKSQQITKLTFAWSAA
jgi:hypothetical protein